jgi:hypothetical protein
VRDSEQRRRLWWRWAPRLLLHTLTTPGVAALPLALTARMVSALAVALLLAPRTAAAAPPWCIMGAGTAPWLRGCSRSMVTHCAMGWAEEGHSCVRHIARRGAC